MNSSVLENDEDFEKSKQIVKYFLNEILASIVLIEESGYDCKDIYDLYDLLRYDILSDKNIDKLYSEGQISEYIKKLNIYNSLIKDLTNDLKNKRELIIRKKDRLEYLNEKKTNKTNKLDLSFKHNKRLYASILLTAGIITGNIFQTKAFYNGLNSKLNKEPEVKKYSFDTLGHMQTDTRYDSNYNEYYTIEDYSLPDESGNRLRKTYYLKDILVKDPESLKKIDLSVIEPDETEIVYSDIVKDSNVEYRTLSYEIQNKNIIDYSTEKSTSDDILLRLLAFCFNAMLMCLYVMLVNLILQEKFQIDLDDLYFYSDLDDFYDDFYHNIINISKQKIFLRKTLKEIKKTEKEIGNLDKIVNTLCNRIDKTIIKLTDEIANQKVLAEYQKSKEVKAVSKKFNQINDENQNKSKELFDNISKIMINLSNELTKYGELNEDESKKLLHSIPIDESILFEKEDDHLKIKSVFIPMLKFFDLGAISFENVDIRFIDFRDSNAIVNIRKVYNQDLSFAKFDDENILDWTDYEGVNLTGTVLNKAPGTMINIDKSISNMDTDIERRKI